MSDEEMVAYLNRSTFLVDLVMKEENSDEDDVEMSEEHKDDS